MNFPTKYLLDSLQYVIQTLCCAAQKRYNHMVVRHHSGSTIVWCPRIISIVEYLLYKKYKTKCTKIK